MIRLHLPNGAGSLAQQNSPWMSQDLQRVGAAMQAARPALAGADDLAALAIDADGALAIGAPRARLVLLDSGPGATELPRFPFRNLRSIPSSLSNQLRHR